MLVCFKHSYLGSDIDRFHWVYLFNFFLFAFLYYYYSYNPLAASLIPVSLNVFMSTNYQHGSCPALQCETGIIVNGYQKITVQVTWPSNNNFLGIVMDNLIIDRAQSIAYDIRYLWNKVKKCRLGGIKNMFYSYVMQKTYGLVRDSVVEFINFCYIEMCLILMLP